jgi:hypothetical protein
MGIPKRTANSCKATLHRKLRRIVIDAYTHPALVLAQIEHSLGNDLAQVRVREVVHVHLFGLALELPLAPTDHAPMGCSWRVNSSAKRAVLLQVQRNGDSGSPRLIGSTKTSSASSNPGSDSVRHLRPPPFLRRRLSTAAFGFFLRTSNSCTPRRIVLRDMPVASLTALKPPQPYVCASVAAYCRRIRSSINGASERYRDLIWRIAVAICIPALDHS